MKIFLADDDRIIRLGLQKILTRASEEYEIAGQAADGEDALRQILQCRPDLLITDIKMPIMDGMELTGELRALGLPTKIIILSGFDEYDFVRTTMKNGAVDYLLKPVDRQELLDLVAATNAEIKKLAQEQALAETQEKMETLISRCEEYVQAHLGEKIRLADVANYVGLSECYFSSYFKNKTGETFNNYICKARIEKAKELLKNNPGDRIYEIGAAVGYEEIVTFNRNFKKIAGISPREYRELIQKE